MITVRRAEDRGHFDHGWLNTYHTFSFADYFDPHQISFRQLRVMNEDWVEPGMGFPTHPHRDMEIITYVLEGALEHKDSMGNGSIIRPGEVQRMSAGTGITHSEFNPSRSEPVHLLQIWILPERRGLQPSYEQKYYPEEEKRGKLPLIGSRDGRDGSVLIEQDVQLFATLLKNGAEVAHQIRPNGYDWLQVARGSVMLNDSPLKQGDGAAISGESTVKLTGQGFSEVLLFDLL